VLKKAHAVAGVFELMDIGPDLGLPSLFVGGRLAAGGAAGMKGDGRGLSADRLGAGQFDEDATDFLNLLVWS